MPVQRGLGDLYVGHRSEKWYILYFFVDKTCTFNPNSTQMQIEGKFKFKSKLKSSR